MTQTPEHTRRPRVVVVGGGISGLAAAWRLCRERHDLDVVVLESSPRFGGVLRVAELEGIALDEGAESMLATRPEAVALAREAGLSADIVHPAVTSPSLLVNGNLVPLPSGLVMGVPTELDAIAVSGVLSPQALARLPLDHVMPATEIGDDIALGEYVERRLGADVVDRLVAPIMMGVYADNPMLVSMRAAAPSLFEAAKGERSLLAAARSARRAPSGPVFAGIRGGVGRLPQALAEGLERAGAQLITDVTVRSIRRTTSGWELETGSAAEPSLMSADAIVLAVPAPAAARLLQGLTPAANELAAIETTSVAVVSMLYRTADLPGSDLPTGSGYLVPPSERRHVKAATFSSHKWQWVADLAAPKGFAVVRCSLGHAQDIEVLQREDSELTAVASDDFGFVARLGRARPVASRVSRWGGALPRYAVGHVDRVQRITDAVQQLPGLAVCGSTYDGVGIAACVGRADVAATWISQRLAADGQWHHD